MKKIALFGILILTASLLFIPILCEEQVDVKYQILKDITSSEGTAEYNIILTNNAKRELELDLAASPANWKFDFDQTAVKIAKGGVKNVLLKLTPPKDIMIGSYLITIYAKESGVEVGKVTLKVNIDTDLTPLKADFKLAQSLRAGERFVIEGDITNEDFNIYNSVRIEISGELISEKKIMELGSLNPLQKAHISESLQVISYLKPGKYHLNINGFTDNKRVSNNQFDIEIPSMGTLSAEEQIKVWPLVTKHTITITNIGNALLSESYSSKVFGFGKYFVRANPKPASITKTEDGSKELTWSTNLEPGATLVIVYATNYSIFVILAAAIFLVLFLIYVGKECTIQKTVLRGRTEEGLKTIKVQIFIRNNTNRKISGLAIEDYVPTPLKVVHEKFGTLEPDAIKKDKGKIKLLWKVPELVAKEERILSYNIRSSLSIFGALRLPPAMLRARIGNKVKKFESSSVGL